MTSDFRILYEIPDCRLTGEGRPDRKTMEDIERPRYESNTYTVRTIDRAAKPPRHRF